MAFVRLFFCLHRAFDGNMGFVTLVSSQTKPNRKKHMTKPVITPHIANHLSSPSIYIADVAAYKTNQPRGIWIDACSDITHMKSAINAMLATSPISNSTAYAIGQYDGFGDCHISQNERLLMVRGRALFITKHGEVGQLLLAHHRGDLLAASEDIKYHNEGAYVSWVDYAQKDADACYQCDPYFKPYINYEEMARDIKRETSCLVLTLSDGTLHLISDH
jgi:antirestriction protein